MEKLVDHRRRELVRTVLCIAVVAAFVLSLVPLLLDARYNVPYSDDIENAEEFLSEWNGSHSFAALLRGAAAFTRDTYLTWQGTFASVFLMGLGCGTVFNTMPALTPAVALCLLLFAVWFSNGALLTKGLRADARTVVTITFLEMLLFVQFCPSMYEGFFWFTSVALYLVCYCALLTLLGVLLYLRDRKTLAGKLALFFAALVLCVTLAGGCFTTLLPAGALLVCVLIDAIRRRDRRGVVLTALLLAVFCAGAALNLLAPGNFARLSAESGATTAVSPSPVKAVLLSLVSALGAVLYRLDPAMALFLGTLAVLTAPFAARTDRAFRRPWLVFAVTLGVFATMFAPLMYTKGNIGGLRVQNVYHFALYLLLGFNTAYLTGHAVKRAQGRDSGHTLPESVQRSLDAPYARPLMALTVCVALFFAAVLQRGILKTWSYAAYKDISTGTAQTYYLESMRDIDAGRVPPWQLLSDGVTEADIPYERPFIAYGD